MRFIEVKTTFEIEKEAVDMAEYLLNCRLIACGQIHNINSHYVWNNKRYVEKEYILIMKTKKSLFHKLKNAIIQKHSYQVAEIIATPIINISKEYANWINDNTI